LHDLRLPDFRDYAVKVPKPGAVDGEATRVQGQFIRDVIKLNEHKQYIAKHGEDLPEIRNWKWGASQPASHDSKE
jgi:xylulose-5-phosphate/fructose-6-phosphate phosphoketolase